MRLQEQWRMGLNKLGKAFTFAQIFRMRFIFLAFIAAIVTSSCSLNNAKEDNTIEKYFNENGVTGTFAMFDNGTGQFTVYDMNKYRDSTYLPDSTFEIIQALAGLETGRMKDSLSPVVAIGTDTMKHWTDTLGYKNKVTGDEQLGLVKKLYFGQLPFQPRSQRIVKNMLKKEDNSNYKLSYKTGGGWLVGWIEENNHPYFFVLHVESPSGDLGEVKLKILKDILKQYGFMEGKR